MKKLGLGEVKSLIKLVSSRADMLTRKKVLHRYVTLPWRLSCTWVAFFKLISEQEDVCRDGMQSYSKAQHIGWLQGLFAIEMRFMTLTRCWASEAPATKPQGATEPEGATSLFALWATLRGMDVSPMLSHPRLLQVPSSTLTWDGTERNESHEYIMIFLPLIRKYINYFFMDVTEFLAEETWGKKGLFGL